ncbi:MAG TPA: hypothetical protein VK738_13060 [Terriglobales bacterium]|jgi:virginiamycin B lyase|nr:hypothetical protein [Terriglobales bacterium]
MNAVVSSAVFSARKVIFVVLLMAVPAFAGITEYALTSGSHPSHITSGPDGALWFTEPGTDKIGRITTSGTVTEFALGTGSGPFAIVAGADGALWFTEKSADKIGRITTGGTVTEFSLATGAQPRGIAAGPDGNLWFVEFGANKIGRITTSGTLSEFSPLSANSGLEDITAGPDGNLWFTESNTTRVGRITTAGSLAEFDRGIGNTPHQIAAGPDGNLWATITFPSPTTSPQFSLNPVPTTGSFAVENIQNLNYNALRITTGPDGNLWITETGADIIGRVTPAPISPSSAAVAPTTEFLIPTSNSGALDITTGPDHNLWLTESIADKIGMLVPPKYSFLPIQYTSNPINPVEGKSASGDTAFLNDQTGLGTGNYTTTIDWNDGSPTDNGVFAGSPPKFTVTSTHTYKEEGVFNPTIRLHDVADNIDSVAYSYLNIPDAVITLVPASTLTVVQGMPLNAVVASFTDPDSFDNASSYTAGVVFIDGCSFVGIHGLCPPSPSTIAAGGTAGSYNVASSHTFNGNGTFQVATSVNGQVGPVFTTINVTPATFALQLSSASTAIKAGQSANFTINLMPTSGAINGQVSFSCSNLPALSNYNFSPPSLTPGTNGGSTTLTITTTAPILASLAPSGDKHNSLPLYALALPILGLAGTLRMRRRAAGLLLVLALLGLAVGCGGGHSMTSNPQPQPGTPTGTFIVTVTGTANVPSQTVVVQQSAVIQLQVQ